MDHNSSEMPVADLMRAVMMYYGIGTTKNVDLAYMLMKKNPICRFTSVVNSLYCFNEQIFTEYAVYILGKNDFTNQIVAACLQNNLPISGYCANIFENSVVTDFPLGCYSIDSIPKESAVIAYLPIVETYYSELKSIFNRIYVFGVDASVDLKIGAHLFVISPNLRNKNVLILGN